MRSVFKKILIFIIAICTLWYAMEGKASELNGINLNKIGSALNEKDKLANFNNTNTRKELALVNIENGLSKDYKPESLTIPNIPFATGADQEEKYVAGIIAKPLGELFNAAKQEGIILLGNSAYRSYKSQRDVYTSRIKSDGKKLADAYVAKPGFSEHQTGLCIDITNKSGNFIKGTKEADWLAENCYRFGFIIRYPYGKQNITGIEYEPWHIRYVGKEAAKYIYDNRITLEEYLAQSKK